MSNYRDGIKFLIISLLRFFILSPLFMRNCTSFSQYFSYEYKYQHILLKIEEFLFIYNRYFNFTVKSIYLCRF